MIGVTTLSETQARLGTATRESEQIGYEGPFGLVTDNPTSSVTILAAGQAFNPALFGVGQTVIQQSNGPATTTTQTLPVVQVTTKSLSYFYKTYHGNGFTSGSNYKNMTLTFRNGLLKQYSYFSDMTGVDGTAFDETKVEALKRGETTVPQMVALFGPPDSANELRNSVVGGRVVWGVTGVNYGYTTGEPMPDHKIKSKTLSLLFDTHGSLVSFSYNSSTEAVSNTPGFTPGVTAVPIFIPHSGGHR